MGEQIDQSSQAEGVRGVSRRGFLAGSSAAALSFSIIKPGLVRGAQANSKISLGMIGCGGRGTWITNHFLEHGGYEISAAADYFPDKVNIYGDKFNVPAARRFTGLKGYQRLLEAKVDAVAIESPAYFHPEQAAAAVEAGVHVYLAKPIAVDVPGCRSIEASARRAAERKLAYLIDFQTRTDPFYQEAIRRVHEGDIGRIISGEATYVTGSYASQWLENLKANPEDSSLRLRAWIVSRALSGDIITEQNIHAIDVMDWVLDQHPLKAFGTGGLASRNLGDSWDHFSVIFWFADDVVITFYSKQYGTGADDISCRIYGTDGTLDTHYSGDVGIKGKVPYPGGRDGTLYGNGAIRNIATFHSQVTQGPLEYPTVAASMRSTLTTILGRMAALRHAEVTWDEMMSSEERLDPDLVGLVE